MHGLYIHYNIPAHAYYYQSNNNSSHHRIGVADEMTGNIWHKTSENWGNEFNDEWKEKGCNYPHVHLNIHLTVDILLILVELNESSW